MGAAAATALVPGRFNRQVDMLAAAPADLDLAVAGLAADALGDFRVGRGDKPR
jgi:hypothetical protein